MRALFADYPEACDNTLLIAERARRRDRVRQRRSCRRSRCPTGHDEDSYLRELTIEGAKERYGAAPRAARARAHRVRARRHRDDGLLRLLPRRLGPRALRASRAASGSGPGRGSAAGSCVAYCLRIVDIDPIKYDLLFERFLNPGRKQMPDIDMDFDSRYRGEMIKYAAAALRRGPRRADRHVLHDQGPGRGARRGPRARLPVRRSATRSPSSCRRSSWAATRRCTRASSRSRSYEDGYKMAAELRELYEVDPDAKRVIDVARGPRGAAPPGRHPRRRGGDHPRAAHRVPPDPAQARAGRADRGRRRSSRSTRCTASRTSGC